VSDKVVVIGAGGFVGRTLVEALESRGNEVLVPRGAGSDAAVRVHRVEEFLPLLAGASTVVHVASTSTPGASAGKPLFELQGNLQPTLALLEALQEFPRTHLVYVSSGGTLIPRLGDPSGEGAAVYSTSYYGAGKVAAEQFIEAWCHQSKGRATVFRPSNLYGPGQHERPGFGIIPAAMGALARGEVLQIWGDGSSGRDYLYVDDFMRLLLAAIDAPADCGFRVLNACSGRITSLNRLLELLESASGNILQRTYSPARNVDAPSVRMEATRAREIFDWVPEVELSEGLWRTWRWFVDSRR
jgi:UDP-glucose 4-epimerase